MKVGLFGGTFNPIHVGHLVVASEAREGFDLDRILFIPAGMPPHKNSVDIATAHDRYQMTLLATRSNSFFAVSPLEMERQGKSYSVETVTEMKRIFGQRTQLYFIMGLDAMLEIVTWKQADELVKLCEFIVGSRPGYDFRKLDQKYRRKAHFINVPAFGCSSTEIRQRIREGRTIRYLVPEVVERYIIEHRLYRGKPELPGRGTER